MNTPYSFAKSTLTLLAIVSSVCLSVTARAGFTNGGFETGDFSGWTVRYGSNFGYSGSNPLSYVNWTTVQWDQPLATVVDKNTATDAYVPNFASTFVGNKMAKINDIYGDNHVTQLSQVGTIDLSDLNGGTSANLYINWISVMDNPQHGAGQNPWFNIDVTENGTSIYNVTHVSTDTGWTAVGTLYGDTIYEGSGQAILNGLVVGDQIGVAVTVADCSLGGHGAYAYVDGIGTSFVQPPGVQGVPESSVTLALAGLGLVCLAAFRRRFV